MGRHPLQPVALDDAGVPRFRANEIVRFLLDQGGHDLNTLTGMDFTREDWEQFAQLIGYSLSGFGSLSYVSDETFAAADLMHQAGVSEEQARIHSLEAIIEETRKGVRVAAASLFRIHPDDLEA